MQAGYNITGQKNGTNIWIKLGQSILHTMPLRNNENETLRHPMKSRPDYHETTRAIISMNNEAHQNPQARTVNMALTQLEMVLRGEPTLRFKFYTEASSRIRRRASLGKPRRIDSDI